MANYRISMSGLDFFNESIAGGSIDITTGVDIPGAELSADAFTVTLDFDTSGSWLFSPSDYDGILTSDMYLFGTADTISGDLTQTPYGTSVYLYDGAKLIAKFYVRDVVRVGKTKYKINAMSAVGFLENNRHMGGVYTNKTASALIGEIINGAFTYTVDAAVADQNVAGWLPIDTCRNNLHKLMFALGFSIVKDENGDIAFVFLDNSIVKSVPSDRIYLGGNVDYSAQATAVEVVEHSFYQDVSSLPTQIFSNVGGVAADHLLVEFSEPYYDLTPNGLTIEDYGDNYAVITGVGELVGTQYFHDTKTHTESVPGATGVVPNVVTTSEDTLINSANVQNVVKRLAAYYGSKKVVSADIVLDDERVGDVISFTDAFGDVSSGIISQMESIASSFVKASCKIVTDYVPTGQGNYYANSELISSDGTWTVPSGVTRIRVALIGGGQGGYGGYDGEEGAGDDYDPDYGEFGDLHFLRSDDGEEEYYYVDQPIKNGGAAGDAGSPGKFYIVETDVVPGEVLTFSVGVGGSGGARNGVAGAYGTDTAVSSTSIGSKSSALGASSDRGYYDAITGNAYALAGRAGYEGKQGGQTDAVSLRGSNGADGLPGEDWSEDYTGGAGGQGAIRLEPYTDAPRIRVSGGGGGGGAYGANGGVGGNAVIVQDIGTSGSGGAGADALAPPDADYGCGGDGGNGGGAGGNCGGGWIWHRAFFGLNHGARGVAGKGSVGGRGGGGCAIINY